jgi:tape measure domain-containing protein
MSAVDITFRAHGGPSVAGEANLVKRSLNDVESAGTRASKSLIASGSKMGGAFTNAGKGIGTLSAKVEGFGKSAAATFMQVGSRAAIGLGIAGAAITGLSVKMGLDFYKVKQQAQIAFTTMLGSAEAAKKMLADLASFAAKTPFEFPELVKASQKLLNVGFAARDVIPLMTAVGDAVSAAGGDPQALESTVRALGQIQAKGRLMAEEMMQLNEAGTFSWKALAKQLGVSVSDAMEMVTKGQVSATAAVEAFTRNSNERFGGMMAQQSKSLNGLFSTLKDTFASTMSTVMEPFFERATKGMQRLADYTASPAFTEGVQRFAAYVSGTILPLIDRFIDAVIDAGPKIKEVFVGIGGVIKTAFDVIQTVVIPLITKLVGAVGGVENAVKLMVAAFVALKLAGIVASAIGSLTALGASAVATGASATIMGGAFRAAINGIKVAMISTGVGAALVALGLAAVYVITNWEKVEGFFKRFAQNVRENLSFLWLRIKEDALEAYLGILEPFSKLPGRFGKWARDAKEGAQKELNSIKVDLSKMVDSGTAAGSQFARAFAAAATPTVQAAMAGANVNGSAVLTSRGDRTPSQVGQTGQSGGAGNLTGATAGVNPSVLQMAAAVGAQAGMATTNVMSGKRAAGGKTTDGGISLHGSGNATDLGPYYGATLIKLGQAALIKAGMDPAVARSQSQWPPADGSAGDTVNGWEIIFNTTYGGNHKNHLHIGKASGGATAPNITPDVDPSEVGLGGGPITTGGGTGGKEISGPQKQLAESIGGMVDVAKDLVKRVPEIEQIIVPKLQALYDKLGDKQLSAKALAGIRAAAAEIQDGLRNLIQVDALRDKIPNLRATIGSIVDDATRNKLRKQADDVQALLKKIMVDGITDKELATFRGKVNALNKAVTAAFGEDLKDQVATMRASLSQLFAGGFIDEDSMDRAMEALGRVSAMFKRFAKDGVIGPKEREALKAQLDIAGEVEDAGTTAQKAAERFAGRLRETFRQAFKDGIITDAELAKLGEGASKVGGKIGEAFQAATAAVADARGDFDRAWSDFKSNVEARFRETVIGKFQLTIDFADAYETIQNAQADLGEALSKFSTAAAGALEADSVQVAAAVARVRAAEDEYTAAIVSQDQERIKAAIDARIAASRALKALDTESLSDQAKNLLTAGQVVISAERVLGDQRITEQKKIWEATREEALKGVLAVVDQVGQELRNGEITWSQGVQKIGVALKGAGMDAGSAADLLGSNVESAMGQAATAIERAVTRLTNAITALVRTMGGAVNDAAAKVGEVAAWERALEARSQALNEKYGLGAAAVSQATGGTSGTTSSGGGGGGSSSPPPVVLAPAPAVTLGGVGGRNFLAMAEGGVIHKPFAGFAKLAERFKEAVIPLPPTMDPSLRQTLIALAEGGWRHSSHRQSGAQRIRPMLSRGGMMSSRAAASNAYPDFGGISVPVAVHHGGIITADHDLGRTIAEIAETHIREAVQRLITQGVDPFQVNF